MRQTYGYIRVSTREQNEARQLDALYKAGVEEKKIYMDKQSGKDFDRQGYQRLLHRLRPGDTLFVKSIDRLGRNYNEILEQWRLITKEKNAAIVVLDMPLLDTRQDRDLTGTLIADIVLQLLSYVAQTERESIRQRQREGIAAAKARGVRFGREAIPVPEELSGGPGALDGGRVQFPSGCGPAGSLTKHVSKMGAHASITKRKAISPKFLLL